MTESNSKLLIEAVILKYKFYLFLLWDTFKVDQIQREQNWLNTFTHSMTSYWITSSLPQQENYKTFRYKEGSKSCANIY